MEKPAGKKLEDNKGYEIFVNPNGDFEARREHRIMHMEKSLPELKKWINKKPRCPSCGSRLVHFRLKTKELVCRSCGEITPSPKLK